MTDQAPRPEDRHDKSLQEQDARAQPDPIRPRWPFVSEREVYFPIGKPLPEDAGKKK